MRSLKTLLRCAFAAGVLAWIPCQAQQFNSSTAPHSDSWWWVTTGVTVQVAGSFADWATSWKQPEANSLLAQPSGTYAGRFYRTGTVRKGLFSGGIALLSYAIAWKFPKTRKFVGVFNMAAGTGFAAAALRNVQENPYYKP